MIKQLEQIIGVQKRKQHTLPWRLAYLINKLEEDPKWYKMVLDVSLDRLALEKDRTGKIMLTFEQVQQIKKLYAHI